MIAFGPVPSRRLGLSLGINNICRKVCTYSCVYCQAGRTYRKHTFRCTYHKPSEVLEEVLDKALEAKHVDYLTFVPNGEPTLDSRLGVEIQLLKRLGIKVAVISNGSLMARQDVRRDLRLADWVSLKVDAVQEKAWCAVNRPHSALRIRTILDGMVEFGKSLEGELVTETMLVEGVNDGVEEIRRIADFLSVLNPSKAYLSIPTRPPAEKWVQPSSEDSLRRALLIVSEAIPNTELLASYEGNEFVATGDVEQDLLGITQVHPMRQDAVREILENASADWSVIERLLSEGRLIEIEYRNQHYYRCA
jgi:wyosine [tRNA(Phe)-imidazoG37] synthetase (radical SAM superfamily)